MHIMVGDHLTKKLVKHTGGYKHLSKMLQVPDQDHVHFPAFFVQIYPESLKKAFFVPWIQLEHKI